MATCPECDAEIEIDDDDLQEMEAGDPWDCDGCGTRLRVAALDPLDFENDEDDDDDDEKDDEEKAEGGDDVGLRHEVLSTHELDRPEYRANPANRCYYCKHELYSTLTGLARARGFANIADGSNADDRGDYRPGRQAAREFGVISPLDAAEL